jgi:hypothetical protein
MPTGHGVPDLPARPSPTGWIVAKKINEINVLDRNFSVAPMMGWSEDLIRSVR